MSENARLFHIMAEKMFETSESVEKCKELDDNDVSRVLWALANYFDNTGSSNIAARALALASASTEDNCDCADDCIFNLLQALCAADYLEAYKNAHYRSIYQQTGGC